MCSAKILLQRKKFSLFSHCLWQWAIWDWKRKETRQRRGKSLCIPTQTTRLWGLCWQVFQDSAVDWGWWWKRDFLVFNNIQALRELACDLVKKWHLFWGLFAEIGNHLCLFESLTFWEKNYFINSLHMGQREILTTMCQLRVWFRGKEEEEQKNLLNEMAGNRDVLA